MNFKAVLIFLILLSIPNSNITPSNPIIVEEFGCVGIIPLNATILNISMKSAHVSFKLEFSMLKFGMEFSANYIFESKENMSVLLGFPIKVYEPFEVELKKDGIKLKYEITELENISDDELKDVLYDYKMIVANVTFNSGENLVEIKIDVSSDLKFDGYTVEYPLITAKYWNTSDLLEVVEISSNENATYIHPEPNVSKVVDSTYLYKWSFVGKPGVDKIVSSFETKKYINQRETLKLLAIICVIAGISIITWVLIKRRKNIKG